MLQETVLRLVIIGLCVMITQQFVRRRSQAVAQLAAAVKLPPRLLETLIVVVLAVLATSVILSLLRAVGILVE